MKKQISIAADLGASGGKMARGYFDGDHVEIGGFILTFQTSPYP